MTHEWRLDTERGWVRPLAVLVAGAIFLGGLAAFLLALMRPFEEPRLFLLVCDDDPATIGASPAELLAAANPGRTICQAVHTPVGRDWLSAVERVGEQATHRDTIIVLLRGAWIDDPVPAIAASGFLPGGGEAAAIDIDDIVAHMDKLTAGTLILCLDDADPGLDQFSEQLQRTRSANAVSRVVIVTAHRMGEESFPLPGRQCTAFGHAIAQALGAQADRNRDGGVALHEFLNSVHQQVDGWAALLTGGRESQTPLVLEPRGARSDAIVCPRQQPLVLRPRGIEASAGHAVDKSAAFQSQLVALWDRAGELVARTIEQEVPLVLCRGLHRDVLELERRWCLGESSEGLKREMMALDAVLAALASGTELPAEGPRWARDLEQLLSQPLGPRPPVLAVPTAFAELQALLEAAATKDAVLKWLSETQQQPPNRVRRLVSELVSSSGIPDSLWRSVLQTRLAIERERNEMLSPSWCFAEQLAAERSALRAERLLMDQVERDWNVRAEQADHAAAAALARIQTVEELRTRAAAICRTTLWDFPSLLDADMRLQFWENDPSEVGVILDRILETLARVRSALAREALEDPGLVQRLAHCLEADHQRLLRPVRQIVAHAGTSAASPPAIELVRLLRSTLPSPSERAVLLSAWTRVVAELPGEPPRPTAAGRIIVRGLADGLAENCLRRARLESLFDDASAGAAAALAVRRVDSDGRFLDALREFNSQERRRSLQRPSVLRHQCQSLLSAPLSTDRVLQCQLLWDALDGLRVEEELPTEWLALRECLIRTRSIRGLDHQIELVELARLDASDWELDYYDRLAAELRGARPATPQWPAPAQIAIPALQVPDVLAVPDESISELTLRIEDLPADSGPVQLTVQYDERQYVIGTADGRQLLPAATPPRPYVEQAVDIGRPVSFQSGDPRTVTLQARPTSLDARSSRLLIRLHGANWTARAICHLLPSHTLPVELILADEVGAVSSEGFGFVVEPYPNRTESLQWSLANHSAMARQVGLAIYAVDAAPPNVPRAAMPSDSAAAVLRAIPRLTRVVDIPTIELPPQCPALPVPFPQQDDSKSPVSMQGGLIVAISDQESGLTRLQPVRIRPQRPVRFAKPSIEYERTTGRITILVEAHSAARLPAEGIPVSARLSGDAGGPQPVRSAGRLSPQSPRTTLQLQSDPGANHRVELDIARWPRAFCFDITDGQPSVSEQSAIRVTSPTVGTIYQTADTIPVAVELDTPPEGFSTEGDWFEVGVDADQDRRLDGDNAVRRDRDRNVTLNWLGSIPDGTTVLQVDVGDFALALPTAGIRNQRANILSCVKRSGQAEVWGTSVPVLFDSAAPQLTGVELQPGPTVVIGQPVVLLSNADDAGLSGVLTVEVSFDPTRSGRFDAMGSPVAAVPLEDGTWRAEAPTASLEQGRHLLLARAVDKAGNAEDPRLLWVEAVTAEEAARRRAARTTAVSGTLFYGTQPVSGITVTLMPDQVEAKSPAEPMNTETSSPSAKSYTATSGKDGTFLVPAVPGGKYSLQIEGIVRGQKFERHSELTIDVEHPPSAISVRLDRPADVPADAR